MKEPYDYSPLPERPPLEWPNGAQVAFYLAVNVEHYPLGQPSTSIAQFTQALVPDPLNHGWRDYGPRVGIWRLIELLRAMVAELETATGRRPRGWLGPALTETLATPRLLAELGLGYTLDWCNDDQPYPLDVPGMISVPYSVELNDVPLFVERGIEGDGYVRMVSDQLEQLLEDGRASGRVMALVVHPFVMGQPWRHRHLARALEVIASSDGVWLTTSDAIAAHYLARAG